MTDTIQKTSLSYEKPIAPDSEAPPSSDKSVPSEAPAKPTPPPNGGLQAWTQVFGAFFLFFSSWGLVVAFGAYEDFLRTHQLASYSPSAISWIGTVQGFLLIVVGVITGPIFDMGYLRLLIATGLVLNVLGLMTASVSYQYYNIFLSLGICVGLGSGCLFVPSVAIVAQYFTTKRSMATGIVATGGSVGGIIFPIAFRQLTDVVGWGWANRTLGFIVLVTLLIPLVVMKPRTQPSKRRTMIELSAFKEIPYLFFSLGLFFIFVGLYIPFFYIPTFAQETLGTNANLAFYLVAVLNAGSFLGRLIPNIIADKVGAWNVLLPVTLLTGVFGLIWIGIKTVPGVIVLCIFYGFFSGAVISIPPSALVVISPNIAVVGTRMGMCFSFAGLGLLIGSPTGGAIISTTSGFSGVAAYTGALVILGSLFFAFAWLIHKKKAREGVTRAA